MKNLLLLILVAILLASCAGYRKMSDNAHKYYLETGRYLIKDKPSLTH